MASLSPDFGSNESVISGKHVCYCAFWKDWTPMFLDDWMIFHYCEAYILFFEHPSSCTWIIIFTTAFTHYFITPLSQGQADNIFLFLNLSVLTWLTI